MSDIKTYPEMNLEIKKILSISGQPHELYAVARIVELERRLAENSLSNAALLARLDRAVEVLKKFDAYWLMCQQPSTHGGVTYPYSICIVCDMGQAGYSEAEGIHDTDCPFRMAHETLASLFPAPSAKEKPKVDTGLEDNICGGCGDLDPHGEHSHG